MASISDDGNGRKRILFIDGSGDRKAIRLGKMSVRMAEKIKIMVEALNAAKITNCSRIGKRRHGLRTSATICTRSWRRRD